MTSLAALLLASPVFGFSLNPPSVQPVIDPAVYAVVAADLRAATPALLQASEESTAESGDGAGAAEPASRGPGEAMRAPPRVSEEIKSRDASAAPH